MLISDGPSRNPNGQFYWPSVCAIPVMLTASVPGAWQGTQAPVQDWASSGWSAGGDLGPLSRMGVARPGPTALAAVIEVTSQRPEKGGPMVNAKQAPIFDC